MIRLTAPLFKGEHGEASLEHWLKRPGQPFTEGEAICQIRCAVGTVTVSCTSKCILEGVRIFEGDIVESNQELGMITLVTDFSWREDGSLVFSTTTTTTTTTATWNWSRSNSSRQETVERYCWSDLDYPD